KDGFELVYLNADNDHGHIFDDEHERQLQMKEMELIKSEDSIGGNIDSVSSIFDEAVAVKRLKREDGNSISSSSTSSCPRVRTGTLFDFNDIENSRVKSDEKRVQSLFKLEGRNLAKVSSDFSNISEFKTLSTTTITTTEE